MFPPDVIWMTYICSHCESEHVRLDNRVWIDSTCLVCEQSGQHHIQWAYPLYEEAKRVVGVLWTKPGDHWASCAVCGKPRPTWIGHHILSQRYKAGVADIRNIVPVCSIRCHELAHGGKQREVFDKLCLLLGNGNIVAGEQIFRQGKELWLPKTGDK